MSSTCASASGKVLLAGGYLVLDPKYSGLVLSTSSRFFSLVTDGSGSADRLPRVSVRSPQFKDATWEYSIDVEGSPIVVTKAEDAKNKFVETALQGVFELARTIKGPEAIKARISKGLQIVILGDNDFYSQREQLQRLNLPPTFTSTALLPRFQRLPTSLSTSHKTGLGSSAALITSLVLSLLVHLSIPPKDQILEDGMLTPSALALAHTTAQWVHCKAQGKVGSGFDVAAALYGSCVYTRFDPQVLAPVMSSSGVTTGDELARILSPLNTKWNQKIVPFHLPPGLRIVLADVEAGSDTPSLVGKVLKWRSEDPSTADALWDTIADLNGRFASALENLNVLSSTLPESEYNSQLSALASLPLSESTTPSPLSTALLKIRTLSQEIRMGMKRMGQLSHVPIEPDEQSELLDKCLDLPGVVGGGVPGAGGYDAIWLLLIDPNPASSTNSSSSPSPSSPSPNQTLSAIEDLWANWSGMNVSPLGASESRTGGARIEFAESVPGLMDALKYGWS